MGKSVNNNYWLLPTKIKSIGGGAKMAEEYDGETTLSPQNSSKEHLKR